MREIKFRAWNGAEQKMHGNVGISPHTQEYHVFDKYGAIHDAYGSMPVLMQFTGLKDRNGKEVYEGDILKMGEATAKVVFWGKPPEFGLDFYHNEDAWCEDWNLSDDSTRMEIVGNVYEHPELLNRNEE